MRWSDERILTTHTGSLPRPPELTRLYVQRARGGEVDPAELDRLGKAALRRIVDKQVEAGIDIGNNGEQQREAFFLYVRHRMSGFGSSWKRWPRGDEERILRQRRGLSGGARPGIAYRIRGDRRQRLPVAARLSRPRARTASVIPGPAPGRVPRLCRARRRNHQPGDREGAARPA